MVPAAMEDGNGRLADMGGWLLGSVESGVAGCGLVAISSLTCPVSPSLSASSVHLFLLLLCPTIVHIDPHA